MAASDAIPVPRKNTAFRMTFPVYDTSGALKSSLASADSEISLDGAAFADCTNEVTEIGSTGFYYIDLTSGEMNADTVAYKLTGTGINTLTAVIYPEEAGDYRAAVTSIGAGVITAASIDTGAIDADALAADAVTEIQSGLATAAALATVDGVVDAILLDTAEIGAAGAGLTAVPWNPSWDAEVQSEVADALAAFWTTPGTLVDLIWDEAIAGHAGAGSTGLALSSATAPTAAAVADAVWDEAISGHLSAGSTGEALNAAGAAGDPWTITLPGAYTGSQAGKVLSDIITDTAEIGAAGAGLTALASAANLATVDTVVGAILVDTAEIGAAGAGLTAVPWNASWDAQVESEVTDALNAYDPPTKAELDSAVAPLATAANLSTVAGYLDTEIAAILEDTGTTLPGLIAALNDIAASDILTTQLVESYSADGAAPTLTQAVFLIMQFLYERSVSSTTMTVKKLDGSTTAATATLDSATAPTSITRAS